MRKEIIELGEDVLEDKLLKLRNMSEDDEDYVKVGSLVFKLFDKLNEAEKTENDNLDKMAQRENEAERNRIDEEDKEEKRIIEREKAQMQAETEREKQKISVPKVVIEVVKIVAPVMISGAIFMRVHNENMEFEETGSFHSSTGKGLNNVLNRFLKF